MGKAVFGRGDDDETTPDRSWMPRGRCHPTQYTGDVPPEKFFYPARTNVDATQAAVDFCKAGCPVRAECLEYAITVVDAGVTGGDLSGVFGGTSPQQRAQVRRALRARGKT